MSEWYCNFSSCCHIQQQLLTVDHSIWPKLCSQGPWEQWEYRDLSWVFRRRSFYLRANNLNCISQLVHSYTDDSNQISLRHPLTMHTTHLSIQYTMLSQATCRSYTEMINHNDLLCQRTMPRDSPTHSQRPKGCFSASFINTRNET